MDTLKILLGATMALLLGALVVFTNRMNDGVKEAPKEDVAAMQREIAELRAEMERLDLERQRKMLQEVSAQPSGADLVTRDEAEEKAADLEERLKQLEMEAVEAKADAERAEAEAGFLTERYTESRDKTERRARVINNAMLIATIKEWVDDPNFGGFAILNVQSQDNVQTGSVLAIRRNGGILGKLRVGEVTIEGAVANPISNFSEIKPQAGDELILDEVVQLAN
ncbi:hypothetical protein HAHE_12660 [Haloferula helveola]|uniref:Uncharacterized protein n=1 Tax=Haloferula helveola TaxID=490095 RepID=A0ABM7R8I6_9BACT|nr:hypothetical protein HAHE_12660 [Haloferula helveola]